MTTTTKTRDRKGKAALTALERKRNQLARDRAAGFQQVSLRVPADKAAALRAFARSLIDGGARV